MSAALDLKAVEEALSQLEARRKQLEAQRLLREQNARPARPSEEDLKKLDSSVKKNSALIKKLNKITEESKAGVLEDIQKTNQSKYVSEAAAAIADASLKSSDVPAAVQVCAALHQRYADFSQELLQALAKALGSKAAMAAAAGGSASRAAAASATTATTGDLDAKQLSRRRAVLRLMAELLAAGVVHNSAPLLAVLKELTTFDFKRDREASQTNLTLLATGLAKAATEQLLGREPQVLSTLAASLPQQDTSSMPQELAQAVQELEARSQALKHELDCKWKLPESEAQQVQKMLDRAFEVASNALVSDMKSLKQLELENQNIINTRGDLPADAQAEYERCRKACESLQRGVQSLAEALGVPMPALDIQDDFTRLGAQDSTQAGQESQSSQAPRPEPVFEDQETRAFYESLPDVRGLVPAVLLGDGKEADKTEAEAASAPDTTSDGTPITALAADGPAATPSTADATAASTAAGTADGPAAAVGTASTAELDRPPPAGEDGQPSTSAPEPTPLESLLARLPSCVSRDLADQIALDFCFLNSKSARKRLIRALCDVPRASLSLVPYYSRVIAVLAPVFPDIPQGVVAHLEAEFASLLRRKDATALTLEPRIRNMRYLGELSKFKLVPYGTVFVMLKQLLDDFSGHNVDAACALVDTAGRFFYRMPETKTRMENMLEVMMRLKSARNIDTRQQAEIDNVFFVVKRPAGDARRRKRRPPLQEYVRHLIFNILNDQTITEVMKKLLKLPWADMEQYLLKCMLKVVRGRFTNIPLISCLAGGLAQHHDSLGIAFVDAVLDDIRWGLDNNYAGAYQKRMADMRLLGELYNYSLCTSTPVFETLYLLLMYGHESTEMMERLDPPTDFFRIRLVCELLGTCGQYFQSGNAGRRLDRFLVFFQAYILSKPPLPLDVEFDVQDLLHNLRPQLKRLDSYEAALAEVQQILASEMGAGGVLGMIGEEDEDEGERREVPQAISEDSGTEQDARSLDDMSPRSSDDERDAEEDDAFEREYAAMVADTQGKMGSISLGMGVGGPGAVARQKIGTSGQEVSESLTFKMLVKRGGKDDKSKELQVPLSASMAASVKAQADAEAREREEMKRLVLAAERQQEQETVAAARAGGRGYRGGGYYSRGRGYQGGRQS